RSGRMGGGSAWIFERGDARRLIDVGARRVPGIDMRNPKHAVLAGIEIGVEHAVAAAELKLEARSLLHLQGWPARMAGEVARGPPRQLGNLRLHRHGLRRFLWNWSWLGPRGAAGKDQGGGEY